jgi:FkbM family methyltransferase
MPQPFMERVKGAITSVADRAGYAVIPKWRLGTLELEQHLRELFRRHAVDTVLDVGANEGQYVDFLRTYVGYEGRIISFEPVPELARALAAKAANDSRWSVYPIALGREDTTLPLTVMANSDLSSFLRPDGTSIGMESVNKALTAQRVEPVSVRRLDGVLAELQRSHTIGNAYLKIDTQGYDLHVLQGAGEAISRFVALQTEVSFLPLYHDAPDLATSLNAFKAAGFDVTGFFPNVNDHHLRVIEMDCVMIRRP